MPVNYTLNIAPTLGNKNAKKYALLYNTLWLSTLLAISSRADSYEQSLTLDLSFGAQISSQRASAAIDVVGRSLQKPVILTSISRLNSV